MNRLNDEWFSSKSESVPLWHKIALSNKGIKKVRV